MAPLCFSVNPLDSDCPGTVRHVAPRPMTERQGDSSATGLAEFLEAIEG